METYLHTPVARIDDPTPYEFPLWGAHESPPGYYWLVERTLESRFSFRLRLIAPSPFVGDAQLALVMSLRKWIVLTASLNRLAGWLGPDQLIYMGDGGWDTCALCILYWGRDNPRNCAQCPIFADTGLRLCHGTPYHDFIEESLQAVGDFLEVARREVAYLRRLYTASGGHMPKERSWPPKTS